MVTLYTCIRCKRKMARDLVVGFTHLLDWTYVCRNSLDCDRAECTHDEIRRAGDAHAAVAWMRKWAATLTYEREKLEAAADLLESLATTKESRA